MLPDDGMNESERAQIDDLVERLELVPSVALIRVLERRFDAVVIGCIEHRTGPGRGDPYLYDFSGNRTICRGLIDEMQDVLRLRLERGIAGGDAPV